MSTLAEPTTASAIEIVDEIQIDASLETTFAALLRRLTSEHATPDGTPLPMVLEPRPGGRWYRDAGGDNGHFWGHVQAIRRSDLLEIVGPMFMSYAVSSNIQYRLVAHEGGTLLKFRHSAYGLIDPAHREGLGSGWRSTNVGIKEAAEG